jgi:WD40 repeat protein
MGVFPNIYIYEYPSLKLYRILRKGTEKSYSSIIFSGSGDYLASVGSEPDYLLTVWDWKQERLLLKSKAFSQEVYRVSFSQFNQNWLTTSGTGHIRFWKIS